MSRTLLFFHVILLFVYSTVSTEDTDLDSDNNFQDSISKRHSGHYSTRTITCSSWSYKFKICNVPRLRQGSVRWMWVKSKQSRSPCRIGSSYGFAGRQVWVNHGCRAKFGLRISHFPGRRFDRIVQCNSWRNKFAKCFLPHGVIRGIRVIERSSKSACTYGRSYGIYRRHHVWVNRGCRAFFHVTKYRY